ncbi:DUF2945 domain-containing protein [Nodosilinea nodulosa]|uniref:DUF2945 domain-containing protein n=1 Tax=Nodosilinea nodulosa TaxID=416001 RepID=UPI0008FB19C4|nr:DUF2945 domain-containing protein [Nodosilinea nodulosa]
MTQAFKPGDRVSWNTAQGKTVGKIVKKLTSRTTVRTVLATKLQGLQGGHPSNRPFESRLPCRLTLI